MIKIVFLSDAKIIIPTKHESHHSHNIHLSDPSIIISFVHYPAALTRFNYVY